MQGVIHGVRYYNQERLNELNKRISNRNIPSQQLDITFDPRSVTTRRSIFPIADCHAPSETPIITNNPYDTRSHFNPGSKAPYFGYANRVDEESRVQNMFMPNQKFDAHTEFVPSSKSDLFNEPIIHTSKPVIQSHPLLFNKQQFNTFNPNPHNMGKNVMNNHTRQQVKNL